jgi:hypothetical protein
MAGLPGVPEARARLERNPPRTRLGRYGDWIGLEYKPTNPASRDFAFLEAIGGSPTGSTAVDA